MLVGFFYCRFSNLRPNAKRRMFEEKKKTTKEKKRVGIKKKWQKYMLARTREKAARQKELDAERERQNECVNDDIWKFMDESIDSGAESVLLLTAQIEVIVHIIILAGWIWCLNTRSHTHKQYIYKIYIWIKHKCKLFGVPCSFVFVYLYWTLYVQITFTSIILFLG